jgi:hypothetical protein
VWAQARRQLYWQMKMLSVTEVTYTGPDVLGPACGLFAQRPAHRVGARKAIGP